LTDDAHAARRKYKKDLDFIKPDLEAYNKQKALAMTQGSGALTTFSPTDGASQLTVTSEEQRMAAENLYRDANTLIYGDNKPSEDAIDQLVGKINKEYVVWIHILSERDSNRLVQYRQEGQVLQEAPQRG
jgi:pre-mRNA-splicing factor SYF2